MCPLCEVGNGCGPWYLNSTCNFVRVSYLFDHGGTVFFAVFMSFWAVCFLENWKRKQVGGQGKWEAGGSGGRARGDGISQNSLESIILLLLLLLTCMVVSAMVVVTI